MKMPGKARNEPDEIRGRARDWVNRQRVDYGFEPISEFPKGIPGSTLSCPVALAFADIFGVGATYTSAAHLRYYTDDSILMKLPKVVSIFIAIFDDRGYLDLEQDPDPPNPHFLYPPEEWAQNYHRTGRCV